MDQTSCRRSEIAVYLSVKYIKFYNKRCEFINDWSNKIVGKHKIIIGRTNIMDYPLSGQFNFDQNDSQKLWPGYYGFVPILRKFGNKFLRKNDRNIQNACKYSWTIAPEEEFVTRKAIFLPGQLERITGWEFTIENPGSEMLGGTTEVHVETKAYELEDVWLIDGFLFKGDSSSQMILGNKFPLKLGLVPEIEFATLYSTPSGVRWFGNWLLDDCLIYPLAQHAGNAMAIDLPAGEHIPEYADLLSMKISKVRSAFFRHLVIFDDRGENQNKKKRFKDNQEKLLANREYSKHPGVFIYRGHTGESRYLSNEIEIADHLKEKYGFKLVDPSKLDVDSILNLCAGAQIVAGVEGSQLMHGISVLSPGTSLLILQPANRFVTAYKSMADREEINFGFVIGSVGEQGFTVDLEELDRTIELLPS